MLINLLAGRNVYKNAFCSMDTVIKKKIWTLCHFKWKFKLKGTCCNKKNIYKNVYVSSQKVCNNSSQTLHSEHSLLPQNRGDCMSHHSLNLTELRVPAWCHWQISIGLKCQYILHHMQNLASKDKSYLEWVYL